MDQWPAMQRVLRRFDQFGWLLGTCGNFSLRQGDAFFLSKSGLRKGEMTEQDFMPLAVSGPWPPVNAPAKPSAEGSLHQVIYQSDDTATAVVHGHTPAATEAGTLAGKSPALLTFKDVEMLKGFAGVDPLGEVSLPLLPNHPVVQEIAADLTTLLRTPTPPAVLIAGHGVTAWGASVDEACRHFEIAEFLCRLALERAR